MSQNLLELGINAFGGDIYPAGTWIYKTNLKAPIRYIEAVDEDNPPTISGIKYELGGANADDSLYWVENGTPLTPAMGVLAFSREVLEFTTTDPVKVYYASKPRTQLELVDDERALIGDDSLEVIHF